MTTATPPTRRRRRVMALAATLALGAGLLTMAPSPASAVSAGTAKKGTGFSIKVGKGATGHFIGAYRLTGKGCTPTPCGTVALDGGRNLASSYDMDKIVYTADISGPYSGPNAKQTARVGYLMSKYGKTKSAKTAAALDASVLTILSPNSTWAYNKTLGKKRFKATRKAAALTKLTRSMLAESARLSGPYNLVLRAQGSDAALTVRLTAKALSGAPLANRSVSFMIGSEGPYTVTTDSSGRANLAVGSQTPGEKQVTATIAGLPDYRVYYVGGIQKRTTRLAIASPRVTASASTTSSVKGDQLVAVSSPAVTVPGNFAGKVGIDGWGGDRTLTSSLHGPYATAAEAQTAACAKAPTYTATSTVNADGVYPLATGASSVGYWTYKVTIAGNSTNNSYTTCSAPFAAKAKTNISVVRRQANENTGATVPVTVNVSGLTSSEAKTVTVRLYGPYNESANVACGSSKVFKSFSLTVRGNGAYKVAGAKLNTNGYYGWYAALPEGGLYRGAATPCPPTSKFRVS